jgi:hypothetical protein
MALMGIMDKLAAASIGLGESAAKLAGGLWGRGGFGLAGRNPFAVTARVLPLLAMYGGYRAIKGGYSMISHGYNMDSSRVSYTANPIGLSAQYEQSPMDFAMRQRRNIDLGASGSLVFGLNNRRRG